MCKYCWYHKHKNIMSVQLHQKIGRHIIMLKYGECYNYVKTWREYCYVKILKVYNYIKYCESAVIL